MPDPPPYDLAERTFRFACAIVRFTRKLSQEPGVVRRIAGQLADAGTSVAANYEEAKGAYSLAFLDEANQLVAIFTTSIKRLKRGDLPSQTSNF